MCMTVSGVNTLVATDYVRVTKMEIVDTNLITITLCGGGHSAHVGAGVLGHREDHVLVNILTRSKDVWDNKITIINPDGSEYVGKIQKVTSDPSEVIPQSDIVIFCCPGYAHIPLLKTVSPYLRKRTLLGSMMCQGGFDWMVKKYAPNSGAISCGLKEIPWVSRIKVKGKSAFMLGAKDCLWIAVNPKSEKNYAQQMMERCFGQPVKVLPSFLICTLSPGNQVIHPARYYGIFRDWDGKTPYSKEDIPLLYTDMDEFSAKMMSKLSNELISIRDALESRYPSMDLSRVQAIDESMIDAYGDKIRDKSSMRSVFQSNEAYIHITTPVREVDGGVIPDETTRLFTDDVPFGLCILKDLALKLELETPGMDECLLWMQKLMGKEYLVDGELKGKNMSECGTLDNYDFLGGLEELFNFMDE